MSDQQASGWNMSHQLATQYAIEGLKALTLAQGGAVVAILSFAGNAGPDRIKPALVASSLTWFAWGLASALVTFLTTYTAQGFATHDNTKWTNRFEWAGYGFVLASLVLFLGGVLTAKQGFTSATPSVPHMVASCELEGVRLYRNPATRDERVGEYIVTCMRAKGHAFSVINTPCSTSPNLRDPACYPPATP